MRAFTLILVGSLAATAAYAQTATSPTTTAPGTTVPNTSVPSTTAPAGTSATRPVAPSDMSTGTAVSPTARGGIVDRNTGTAAASGDRNQAVATTDANAPQPAHGRNSFTEGEARRRIGRNGYTHVASLRKDKDGVWRGTATKDGAQVKVWLDYKGNVGAS